MQTQGTVHIKSGFFDFYRYFRPEEAEGQVKSTYKNRDFGKFIGIQLPVSDGFTDKKGKTGDFVCKWRRKARWYCLIVNETVSPLRDIMTVSYGEYL